MNILNTFLWRHRSALFVLWMSLAVWQPGWAQTEGHHHPGVKAAPGADGRQVVDLPQPMRTHMLANMRDHLLALQEIQEALGSGAFDKASTIAEQRLGLSSLQAHGAAHLASMMPKPMQELGTQMHRAASRFALEAQNASVGQDLKPALKALAGVTSQCVACHASYRLK